MMATDENPPSDPTPDKGKKPPKTARYRTPKAAWPDEVDDVELERALFQVPPHWLLAAFILRGYGWKGKGGTKDVPWEYLGKSDPDHYGKERPGRKVLCGRCHARNPDAPPTWVALRSWFHRDPAEKHKAPDFKRLFRIGQCAACGAGYWTEVKT